MSDSESDFTSDEESTKQKKVYFPGDKLNEGEELTYDPDAYKIFHKFGVGCSCLSFDVIPNSISESTSSSEKLSILLVSGTQSPTSSNKIIISQLNEICENKNDDDETDNENEGEDSEKDLPNLTMIGFKHNGNVNRIKRQSINDHEIVASWSDNGSVFLWDISNELNKLKINIGITNKEKKGSQNKSPLFQFSHKDEGYALSWSNVTPGRLASGDCGGYIHIWEPHNDGTWSVGLKNLSSNNSSIEDLQWSPTEQNILASCGCDGNIRIWDCRQGSNSSCITAVKASTSDLNVISWAKNDPYIISGDDIGMIKVWDIRKLNDPNCQHVAFFKQHSKAITSLEFHPTESTIFASSGEDDQVCQWDLSAEADEHATNENIDIPPQLLFIHLGQTEVKEVHWHPQIDGLLLTVDIEHFNVFKTISI